MLLKEWMSTPVQTLDHEGSLADAAKLFRSHGISLLPIISNGEMIGILSHTDLKKATPTRKMEESARTDYMDYKKAVSIMSWPVITVGINQTIDEAAHIMLQNRIHGLPVLDTAGTLKGIVTRKDILSCLISYTRTHGQGQIFVFQLQDKPGIIKTIIEMIQARGGRLKSVLTSYKPDDPYFRKVFFNVFDLSPEEFETLAQGFKTADELLYMADLSRNIRIVC